MKKKANMQGKKWQMVGEEKKNLRECKMKMKEMMQNNKVYFM